MNKIFFLLLLLILFICIGNKKEHFSFNPLDELEDIAKKVVNEIVDPLKKGWDEVKNGTEDIVEKAINSATKELKLNEIKNFFESFDDIFGGVGDIFKAQFSNIQFLLKFFFIFINFSGKMFKKMKICQSIWIKTAFIRDRLSFILDNFFDILILLNQALNNFMNPLTWGKFIYNTIQKLNIIKSYLQDNFHADIESLREIPLIKCINMSIGIEFVKSYIKMSKTLIEKITELMKAFNKTLNGLDKAGVIKGIPQIFIIDDPWKKMEDHTKDENLWNQNEETKSEESTYKLIQTIMDKVTLLTNTDMVKYKDDFMSNLNSYVGDDDSLFNLPNLQIITPGEQQQKVDQQVGVPAQTPGEQQQQQQQKKCWIKMPTGCGKNLRETNNPEVWFVDPSNKGTACEGSRKTAFNKFCSKSDAMNYWGASPPASKQEFTLLGDGYCNDEYNKHAGSSVNACATTCRSTDGCTGFGFQHDNTKHCMLSKSGCASRVSSSYPWKGYAITPEGTLLNRDCAEQSLRVHVGNYDSPQKCGEAAKSKDCSDTFFYAPKKGWCKCESKEGKCTLKNSPDYNQYRQKK